MLKPTRNHGQCRSEKRGVQLRAAAGVGHFEAWLAWCLRSREANRHTLGALCNLTASGLLERRVNLGNARYPPIGVVDSLDSSGGR